MRKEYQDPELEILRFQSEDIIAVSEPGKSESEEGDNFGDIL